MLALPPGIVAARFEPYVIATSAGVAVSGSGTHTKGSWVSMLDPTSYPVFGIWLYGWGLTTNATITGCLLDVAYGPTGGGNELVVVPNVNLGAAPGFPGKASLYFPCYVPAGVRISVRCQTAVSSDTVQVWVGLAQTPFYRGLLGAWQDYGTDLANSQGVDVLPGASGAWGNWTQIVAATARPHRWWAMLIDQGTDTATSSGGLLSEVGIGPDSSNVTKLFETLTYQDSSEFLTEAWPFLHEAVVPGGAKLWVRIAHVTTQTSSRGVILYGL